MDEDTWQAQRTSFGSAATLYEQGRPGYPEQALEWLTGPARRRVLDLGAGTGKLTRQLRAAGHEVVAVEPLSEMRAVLAAALPDLVVLDGTAESIPLPDRAVDLVVAGQAYHWFEPALAHPEIARVLRPGGVFGVLWNWRDDTVPWVAALSAMLSGEDSSTPASAMESLDTTGHFGPAEGRVFRHEQPLDRDKLLALVSSRSYVITLPEPERNALLAHVAELTRTHPDLAGRETFSLPYVTRTFRAIRIE
jgi:SAM-dependent methyltransferase